MGDIWQRCRDGGEGVQEGEDRGGGGEIKRMKEGRVRKEKGESREIEDLRRRRENRRKTWRKNTEKCVLGTKENDKV